ncbi:hypothetical protein KAS14_02040 [Candidatus Bathyarchaeota archaeon]|nr:hypothetical protein [Candidatus Bathyarchaeota archaeon]
MENEIIQDLRCARCFRPLNENKKYLGKLWHCKTCVEDLENSTKGHVLTLLIGKKSLCGKCGRSLSLHIYNYRGILFCNECFSDVKND